MSHKYTEIKQNGLIKIRDIYETLIIPFQSI